jgi:DNA-binding GntR family transcriptional regulator
MAENDVLLQCWLVLGVEVSTAFAVYWTYFDQMDLVDFHAPIVEAIRAGDAVRARAEARKHVRRTEQVVRRRTRSSKQRVMSAAMGRTAFDTAGAGQASMPR